MGEEANGEQKPSIGKRARQRLRGRRMEEVAGGYAFQDKDGVTRTAQIGGGKVSLDYAKSRFDYAGTPSFKQMRTRSGFKTASRFQSDGTFLQEKIEFDWNYDYRRKALSNARSRSQLASSAEQYRSVPTAVLDDGNFIVFCHTGSHGAVTEIYNDKIAFVFARDHAPSFAVPRRPIDPSTVVVGMKKEMTEADIAHARKVLLPQALEIFARAAEEVLEVSVGIEQSHILDKKEIEIKANAAKPKELAEAEMLFASAESLAEIVEGEVVKFLSERPDTALSEAERALFMQKLIGRLTADPKQLVLLLSRDESLRRVLPADITAGETGASLLRTISRATAGEIMSAPDLDVHEVRWSELIEAEPETVLGTYGVSDRGGDAVVALLAAIVPNRVQALAFNALSRQQTYEVGGVAFDLPSLSDTPADLSIADAWRVVSGESGIDR